MANTKFFQQIPADFDPYRWKCDLCGKEQQYTQEEIDTTKKPYTDPQNHAFDFYISCPFCRQGGVCPKFCGSLISKVSGLTCWFISRASLYCSDYSLLVV